MTPISEFGSKVLSWLLGRNNLDPVGVDRPSLVFPHLFFSRPATFLQIYHLQIATRVFAAAVTFNLLVFTHIPPSQQYLTTRFITKALYNPPFYLQIL